MSDFGLLPTFDSSQRWTPSESRKIAVMHQRHGKRQPERRCGECVHLVTYRYNHTYFKCALFGQSSGPGTDWRKKWPACGKFQA